MPRATLSFDLPDESQWHSAALHGSDWRAIVSDIDGICRSGVRYGAFDGMSPSDVCEEIRKSIREACASRGVFLP